MPTTGRPKRAARGVEVRRAGDLRRARPGNRGLSGYSRQQRFSQQVVVVVFSARDEQSATTREVTNRARRSVEPSKRPTAPRQNTNATTLRASRAAPSDVRATRARLGRDAAVLGRRLRVPTRVSRRGEGSGARGLGAPARHRHAGRRAPPGDRGFAGFGRELEVLLLLCVVACVPLLSSGTLPSSRRLHRTGNALAVDPEDGAHGTFARAHAGTLAKGEAAMRTTAASRARATTPPPPAPVGRRGRAKPSGGILRDRRRGSRRVALHEYHSVFSVVVVSVSLRRRGRARRRGHPRRRPAPVAGPARARPGDRRGVLRRVRGGRRVRGLGPGQGGVCWLKGRFAGEGGERPVLRRVGRARATRGRCAAGRRAELDAQRTSLNEASSGEGASGASSESSRGGSLSFFARSSGGRGSSGGSGRGEDFTFFRPFSSSSLARSSAPGEPSSSLGSLLIVVPTVARRGAEYLTRTLDSLLREARASAGAHGFDRVTIRVVSHSPASEHAGFRAALDRAAGAEDMAKKISLECAVDADRRGWTRARGTRSGWTTGITRATSPARGCGSRRWTSSGCCGTSAGWAAGAARRPSS